MTDDRGAQDPTALSRGRGYELGEKKEANGLKLVDDFFQRFAGAKSRMVEGLDNFFRGDFEFPSGETIEVKSQGIDPNRYGGRNVVEAFEQTGDEKHDDGFGLFSSAVQLPVKTVQESTYFDGADHAVGTDHISPSIITAVKALGFAYVNAPDDLENPGRRFSWLYFCHSRILLGQARFAVLHNRLKRGPGGVNDDGFVFYPYVPSCRFRLDHKLDEWRWGGKGDLQVLRSWFQRKLLA